MGNPRIFGKGFHNVLFARRGFWRRRDDHISTAHGAYKPWVCGMGGAAPLFSLSFLSLRWCVSVAVTQVVKLYFSEFPTQIYSQATGVNSLCNKP